MSKYGALTKCPRSENPSNISKPKKRPSNAKTKGSLHFMGDKTLLGRSELVRFVKYLCKL